MKKFKNLLYFIPLILCLLIIILAAGSDVLYFTDYTLLVFNLTVMSLAGVLMSKGKVWGAVLGFVCYLGLCVWDYLKWLEWIKNTYPGSEVGYVRIPSVTILWPVILFYFICGIVLISKSKQ